MAKPPRVSHETTCLESKVILPNGQTRIMARVEAIRYTDHWIIATATRSEVSRIKGIAMEQVGLMITEHLEQNRMTSILPAPTIRTWESMSDGSWVVNFITMAIRVKKLPQPWPVIKLEDCMPRRILTVTKEGEAIWAG